MKALPQRPTLLHAGLTGLTWIFILASLSLNLYVTVPAQSRQLQQEQPISNLPSKAKRWALVIGVDQYGDPQISPLKGAANDARALHDALINYAGFPEDQVILLATDQPVERQPTRVNILRRLSNLAAVVPKDGLLLVSFAGHGMERKNQAFLLPSDAQINDDISFLEETAISAMRMRERIRDTGVGQVLLLLDACRNDPGGRADAPNPLTLAYTRAFNFDVRNREVQAFATLYATAVGQRAYEYTEKHQGYFTWAVVEALKGGAANGKGEVTLASLLNYVQEVVPKQIAIDLGAGKQQRPFAVVEGYRADELVLSVIGNTQTAASSNSTKGSDAIEQEFWDSIKNSTDAEDFRTYIKEYPDGLHVVIARNNLRRLDTARRSNVNSNRSDSTSAASNLNNTGSMPAAKPPVKELLQRSYSLWRACDYDEAINLATEGISREPNSSEAFAIRGVAHLFKLELDQAISDLSEAIRLQPNNTQAISWRAVAYLGRQYQGDGYSKFHPLGIKDLETVLQRIVNPREAWEYEARGYAHYEKSQYDLAISDLDEAIRLDPQDLFAYSIRGAARNWKGNKLSDEIGIQDMSESIRLNPRFIIGYAYRGFYRGLDSQGKETAINDLSEAIRLSPKGIITHQLRGGLYKDQNQYDLAIKDYSEGIRLGERTYLKMRAEAYVSKGSYEFALRDYTEYMSSYPNDADVYTARAKIYFQLGNYEAALSDYTEYINRNPNEASTYKSRAEVYLKLGRTALAEADKRKADELEKKK